MVTKWMPFIEALLDFKVSDTLVSSGRARIEKEVVFSDALLHTSITTRPLGSQRTLVQDTHLYWSDTLYQSMYLAMDKSHSIGIVSHYGTLCHNSE